MLTALALAACSWNAPGHQAFVGSVPDAVADYADVPEPVRRRLARRMAVHDYDDVAQITRDHIRGRHDYADLRDMHFGAGRVCRAVERSGWTAAAVERALVYCDSGHCIIVPTVCRNVARVTRLLTTGEAPLKRPGAAGLPPAGAGPEPSLVVSTPEVPALPQWIELALPRGVPGLAPGPLSEPPVTLPPSTDASEPIAPRWAYGPGPLVYNCCWAVEFVPAVPEAPTWSMAGMGVLLVGGWVARRRQGRVRGRLEARSGVEPDWTDLQSVA